MTDVVKPTLSSSFAGLADCALALGFEKMERGSLSSKVFVMEVFWKLVKGELRQQLMSYAEEFNVDLMH